ncbi:MAG: T9SS type A sorting domain-containing protein [Bacteroidota bacterium]|nr:T9SS type A sorting domain-containing protein [Bacteroidota bacterium]
MKKIFTLLFALFCTWLCSYTIAQQAKSPTTIKVSEREVSVNLNTSRAQRDTLFLFDGQQFFINPQDQPDFEFLILDGDSVDPDPSMALAGWQSEFMFLYSTDQTFFFPDYDTDTAAFFIGSTSYLETPGKVDNWFSFGPITINDSSAMLNWYHLIPDSSFSDGYRVFISPTGVSPVDDVDTTETPLFERLDCTGCPEDTTWTLQSVSLSEFVGDSIWVHFNHNANDQFVLYLDMISITEGPEVNNIPVVQDNVRNFNNYPNPVKNQTTITYDLDIQSDVALIIYDIAGKEILNLKQGYKSKGNYKVEVSTTEMQPGVYFYSIVAENKRVTRKMIVQ